MTWQNNVFGKPRLRYIYVYSGFLQPSHLKMASPAKHPTRNSDVQIMYASMSRASIISHSMILPNSRMYVWRNLRMYVWQNSASDGDSEIPRSANRGWLALLFFEWSLGYLLWPCSERRPEAQHTNRQSVPTVQVWPSQACKHSLPAYQIRLYTQVYRRGVVTQALTLCTSTGEGSETRWPQARRSCPSRQSPWRFIGDGPWPSWWGWPPHTWKVGTPL